MWSARDKRRRTQRGYTMVEIATSLSLIAGVSVLMAQVLMGSRNADSYIRAVTAATQRGQRVAYEVAGLAESSRRIFQKDAVGEGYLASLDLARDPMTSDARLPVMEEDGALGPDEPGAPRTGNVLLMVRESDPAACVANPQTGEIRNISLHRLVCVYPHESTRVLLPGAPASRDLIIWRSIQFPSYTEIMSLKDPDMRKNVVRDLHDRFGLRTLWDEGAASDQAFYLIDGLGTVDAAPSPSFLIEEDRDLSSRGRLVYADAQLAPTDYTMRERRPVLTVDPPGTWAPHGFEVKVGGPSTSRQVWMRLVIEVSAQGGQGFALFASTNIANAQEY